MTHAYVITRFCTGRAWPPAPMTHAYVITHDQIAELSLLICDLDQPGCGQEIKTAAQAAHQIIMDVLGDQVGTLYDMSEAT